MMASKLRDRLLQAYSDKVKVGEVFPIEQTIVEIQNKDTRPKMNTRVVVTWLRANGYTRVDRMKWIKEEVKEK